MKTYLYRTWVTTTDGLLGFYVGGEVQADSQKMAWVLARLDAFLTYGLPTDPTKTFVQ
jgi:hypothetical protein